MRRNIADIQDKRKSSGKGSSEGGRCSPEFDDFFDQTDEVNEKDRLNIQAIEKKSEWINISIFQKYGIHKMLLCIITIACVNNQLNNKNIF